MSELPTIDRVRLDDFMACVMSRQLRDGDWVASGASVPLACAAVFLGLEHRAPDADLWIQGCVSPRDHNLTHALLEPERMRASAPARMSQQEVVNFSLRGASTFQFLRPLQIDPHGNVNVSLIRRPGRLDRHFHGIAVGDAINAVRRTALYVTEHTPRTFVEHLSFRTGTGHDDGSEWRLEAGLHAAGPVAVITPLAVLDFGPERRLRVSSLHPGVDIEQLREATGFPIETAPDCGETPMPTADELEVLHRVDPDELRRLEFRETRRQVLEWISERSPLH